MRPPSFLSVPFYKLNMIAIGRAATFWVMLLRAIYKTAFRHQAILLRLSNLNNETHQNNPVIYHFRSLKEHFNEFPSHSAKK